MPFTFDSESTKDVMRQLYSTLDIILENPFQNPIGRYNIRNYGMKTVHSIKVYEQTQLLWIISTTNKVHLLGLYEERSSFLIKNYNDGLEFLDTKTYRDDPATTLNGYENTQAIAECTVALHRDHIIPYDMIISFVNTILEHNELRYNLWIERALKKYAFNQNIDKQKIYSDAKKNIDNAIKEIIIPTKKENITPPKSLYKKIFVYAKIETEEPNDETIINTILKYLYEPLPLDLDDEVKNRLEKVRKEFRVKYKVVPSEFFTDDSGLYIDVESVITRYKKIPFTTIEDVVFTAADDIAIKRATGWMPGNIFLAPYRKPQDDGNVFDCTVAASINNPKLIHTFCNAYNAMNEFNKEKRNIAVAKKALENLSKIACSRENFWTFTYKDNWKYCFDGKNYLFYPNQIVDVDHGIIKNNEEVPTSCTLLSEAFLRTHTNLSGQ